MERMIRVGINRIGNGIRVSQFTTVASTKSDSMVENLVNSIGFSKEEALIPCSRVSSFKSTANPNAVVDFLRISGFSQTQIKNVISKEPRILFCNVHKTLKPKIQAFQHSVFSGSEIADVLSLCPDVCLRSLNDHIIPTFEMLKSVFGDDNETLIATVKKSTWLLHPSTKKKIPGAIGLLRSYGLPICQIRKFLIQVTGFFSLDTKVLEPILIRVEKLGIPRGSGMFFHGFCALCCVSKVSLESKMGIYKSYGFTDKDLLTLFGKCPYALAYSETKLRKSLDFCMKEAGYYPAEIAWMPNVLSCSLERRVIPRYIVWKSLKERGLQNDIKKMKKNTNDPFLTCIRRSEPEFFKKFVQPFEDRCPDLYCDYMKRMGSVLEVEAAK